MNIPNTGRNPKKSVLETQLEFLQQENSQMKDEIQELHKLVSINKEALSLYMNQGQENIQQQHKSNKVLNNQDNISPFKNNTIQLNSADQNKTTDQRSQRSILETNQLLQKENSVLLKLIDKISQERHQAQGKSLIMEQLFEGADREKKENIEELKDNINNLNFQIQEKEKVISKYEKTTPDYQKLTGIVTQYRDITSVNMQTIKLHEENERLNNIILSQAKYIKKLEDLKKQVANLGFNITSVNNSNLNNTLNQNQSVFNISIIPNIHDVQQQGQSDISFQQQQALVQLQQNLIQEEIKGQNHPDFEMISPLMSPLPDKVKPQGTQQIPSLQLQNQNQINNSNQLNQNQPKLKELNLTQAFMIAEMNAKRSTQQQKQKEGGDIKQLQYKNEKLEFQLAQCRQNLAKEMLENKKLKTENDYMQRFNTELEARNETFVKSYQYYQQKWQKIWHAFQFYKEFYTQSSDEKIKIQVKNNNFYEGIVGNNKQLKNNRYNTYGNNQSQQEFLTVNKLNTLNNSDKINIDLSAINMNTVNTVNNDEIQISQMKKKHKFNPQDSILNNSILDVNPVDIDFNPGNQSQLNMHTQMFGGGMDDSMLSNNNENGLFNNLNNKNSDETNPLVNTPNQPQPQVLNQEGLNIDNVQEQEQQLPLTIFQALENKQQAISYLQNCLNIEIQEIVNQDQQNLYKKIGNIKQQNQNAPFRQRSSTEFQELLTVERKIGYDEDNQGFINYYFGQKLYLNEFNNQNNNINTNEQQKQQQKQETTLENQFLQNPQQQQQQYSKIQQKSDNDSFNNSENNGVTHIQNLKIQKNVNSFKKLELQTPDENENIGRYSNSIANKAQKDAINCSVKNNLNQQNNNNIQETLSQQKQNKTIDNQNDEIDENDLESQNIEQITLQTQVMMTEQDSNQIKPFQQHKILDKVQVNNDQSQNDIIEFSDGGDLSNRSQK